MTEALDGTSSLRAYTYDSDGRLISESDGSANDGYAGSNPLMYREQYYDSATGDYYLKARNYDAATGRFTQEDPAFDGTNWYVYCGNNPVMMVDPWGLAGVAIRAFTADYRGTTTWDESTSTASFTIAGTTLTSSSTGKNSSGIHIWNENGSLMADDADLCSYFGAIQSCGDGYSNTAFYNENTDHYEVTTIINVLWPDLKYHYDVDNGVIRFTFADNNYWGALWRGGGKLLAEAAYNAALSVDSGSMAGRTVGGINTELQLHWAASFTGIANAQTADMGSMINDPNRQDYDSNAWFWQSGQAAKILAKVNIYNPWGIYEAIKEAGDYFK